MAMRIMRRGSVNGFEDRIDRLCYPDRIQSPYFRSGCIGTGSGEWRGQELRPGSSRRLPLAMRTSSPWLSRSQVPRMPTRRRAQRRRRSRRTPMTLSMSCLIGRASAEGARLAEEPWPLSHDPAPIGSFAAGVAHGAFGFHTGLARRARSHYCDVTLPVRQGSAFWRTLENPSKLGPYHLLFLSSYTKTPRRFPVHDRRKGPGSTNNGRATAPSLRGGSGGTLVLEYRQQNLLTA
jgi:hypothetical protein